MGFVTERQIDFKELGGHNHDGSDDNGSIIRSETPLTDTDETGAPLRYYGFNITGGAWHICRVNLSNLEVLYSRSETNSGLATSVYTPAWNARTGLIYESWDI